MKPVLSLIAILVCAQALYASGLEDTRRSAAFELSGIASEHGSAKPLLSEAGRPVPGRSGFKFEGSFCWQRGRDADAERLGMPFSFCVYSLEISGGLFAKPLLIVSGAGLNGTFGLKVGPPSDGLYKATAVVFRNGTGSSCSAGEDAYIEFSVLADARGKIAAEPFIKAFYGRTPDVCRPLWEYSGIQYTFTAQ